MRDILSPHHILQSRFMWLLFLLTIVIPQTAGADTIETSYPGLSSGLLKSAELVPLDEDILLIADNIAITRSQLLDGIKDHDPKLRPQIEKNLIFILEQEAVQRILLNEARKAELTTDGGDDNRAIQALFEHRTRDLTVSEDEARDFYKNNEELVGGAPFEQVADGIRQYLLQNKRQQTISAYIDSIGRTARLHINEKWVASQNRLAVDNPVDKARHSGKPTMVEFGATGCVPCDMMQPILDKLRKDFPENLNVVFVHVGEEQILAARYGIRSIPVQVFYDAKGQEVFRHVGFFAEKDVLKQLKNTGL